MALVTASQAAWEGAVTRTRRGLDPEDAGEVKKANTVAARVVVLPVPASIQEGNEHTLPKRVTFNHDPHLVARE